MHAHSVIALALLAAGCGGAGYAWDEDPIPEKKPTAAVFVEPPASTAAPSAIALGSTTPAPPEAPARTKTERLAEKLALGWIVFDAPTSRFVAVTSFAEEGNGVGIVGVVLPTSGDKPQFFTLCEPEEECISGEEPDAENVERIDEWLSGREMERAMAIEPVEFTQDKPPITATLPSLAATLVWKTDHLELTRNKKTAKLAKLEIDKEFTARPFRAAASPDGKHLCVLFEMDPGQNYVKGFNLHVEAATYAVP